MVEVQFVECVLLTYSDCGCCCSCFLSILKTSQCFLQHARLPLGAGLIESDLTWRILAASNLHCCQAQTELILWHLILLRVSRCRSHAGSAVGLGHRWLGHCI